MSKNNEKLELKETLDDPADVILNHIADAILMLDYKNNITYANVPAEHFLGSSLQVLKRKKIEDIIPYDSQLLGLISQARKINSIITEYNVNIGNPIIGELRVDIYVSPLINVSSLSQSSNVLVQMQKRTTLKKINQRQTHRSATRSVSGMAAMLAHEIKNPLSSIKGSAQILSEDMSNEDRSLTDLICEEVDRICSLVDRMEVFSDHRQIKKSEINIHSVLKHVKKLAETGFGKHVKFIELYDPSLPNTIGDKGGLIQTFLNLIKNACEAVPVKDGQVSITTAFRQGVRVASDYGEKPLHLPLEICIIDNGDGVANDIKENIFDPFVTTKSNGKGLGLALVAKTLGEHGGIIECESGTGNTTFRILLPAATKRNG